MATLKKRGVKVSQQGLWVPLWNLFWLFFLIWFFQTTAGRTFTEGRQLFGSALTQAPGNLLPNIAPVVIWLMLAAVKVLVERRTSTMGARLLADKWDKKVGAKESLPYPQRNFLSLYGGGGIFATPDNASIAIQALGGPFFVSSVIVLALFYVDYELQRQGAHMHTKWSVASLALMYCFLLTAVLTDGVRMLFVYILHRRAFG